MGKLLRPTSIAVIGASAKPGNVGGRIVGELEGCGYQGQVYAIHPRAERVLNAEGFAEVGSISSGVDFAALCVPDDALVPTLESLASDGVKGFSFRPVLSTERPALIPKFPTPWPPLPGQAIWRFAVITAWALSIFATR
ncbi:hypothetical protein HED49_20335 [Ochrobactrum daejeonense]|nr:hypothetical protein [Brucella daejeonensis]